MNFIFFGTNRFSAIVLDGLIKAGFTPSALVTAPDALVGRKQIPTASPAKLVAQQHGIQVLQPESLKKDPAIARQIASYKLEFAVVAAYAKLIPQSMLDLFPRQVLNVHPSLLPLWRGPSPIESAIMHGDSQTGITIIVLDQDMDHGPMLAQEKTTIGPDEYFEPLYERLAVQGAELLIKTIPQWLAGKVSPIAQDHAKATFSKKLSWQDGKLDAAMSVHDAYNRVRALSFEPGTWIEIPFPTKAKGLTTNGEYKPVALKILKAKPMPVSDLRFTIYDLRNNLKEINKKLCFACRDGYLELETVQPQSGKSMSGSAFLNGYRAKLG